MTETEKLDTNFGVRIDNVDQDLMFGVIRVYEQTIGKTQRTTSFSEQVVFEIEEIKEELKKRGFVERRIGGIVYDSKLQIRRSGKNPDLCTFEFNPNLSEQERKNEDLSRRADELKLKFKSSINEFLQSSKYGVALQK